MGKMFRNHIRYGELYDFFDETLLTFEGVTCICHTDFLEEWHRTMTYPLRILVPPQ